MAAVAPNPNSKAEQARMLVRTVLVRPLAFGRVRTAAWQPPHNVSASSAVVPRPVTLYPCRRSTAMPSGATRSSCGAPS